MSQKEVVATELGSVEEVFHSDIPGAFYVRREDLALYYVCPCGCGEMNTIPINEGDKQVGKWQWNGKIAQISIAPSIKRLNGCKYHGHLRAGVWSFAGDSGR